MLRVKFFESVCKIYELQTFTFGFERLKAFMSSALKSDQDDLNQDSLKAFLISAKKAVDGKFQKAEKVHVVIGNESCDLDSAVSAIALSYRNSRNIPVNMKKNVVHVPLLNMDRADFPLQNDIRHVLSEQGIDGGMLVFRSDVDLNILHRERRLVLSLVDFHILPKNDEPFEDAIVEIIDHRKQGKTFDLSIPTLITLVGSCATLVANRLLAEKLSLPRSLVTLLYSTIIADTICMSETAGKKTPDDEAIVKRLEEIDPLLADRRQSIFNEIHKARTDISGLKLPELLRKDLKVVSGSNGPRVTMSSIEESLQKFLERPDVEASVRDFALRQNASAAVLMFLSISQEKVVTRQILVYSPYDGLRKEVGRILENSKDPNLLLSRVEHFLDSTTFAVFNQGNEKASRKVVLPIITENLNALAKFVV